MRFARWLEAACAVLSWLAACSAGAAELKPWTGGPAPVFALKDLQGGLHRLPDYRGKVVLINFWATWCEPCRAEMPSIQRLKDGLKGRPFAVLAVNLDEPESRVRQFLSRMQVDFTVLLDPGRGAAKAWNARILPASYIVGADGKVRYTLVGEADWTQKQIASRIEELLPPGK